MPCSGHMRLLCPRGRGRKEGGGERPGRATTRVQPHARGRLLRSRWDSTSRSRDSGRHCPQFTASARAAAPQPHHFVQNPKVRSPRINDRQADGADSHAAVAAPHTTRTRPARLDFNSQHAMATRTLRWSRSGWRIRSADVDAPVIAGCHAPGPTDLSSDREDRSRPRTSVGVWPYKSTKHR